jgi:glucose-6-phosphate isomerase
MSPTTDTSSSSKSTRDIWAKLQALAANANSINIAEQLNIPGRLDSLSVDLGRLYVDLSKHAVTEEILKLLLDLAEKSQVLDHARQMITGHPINVSENRQALHMGLRNPAAPLPDEFIEHVKDEQAKLDSLSSQIRNGSWTGITGEPITDVINIGIGGSDLGPKMVVHALREFHTGPKVHFISNVDGAEILSLLKTLNAASTLVVVSSKTFTTAETLLNAQTALAWLEAELNLDNSRSTAHCIAITNDREKAQAFGVPDGQILTFADSIGGRYSVWSSIGFSICIALGFDNFKSFLAGGAQVDHHFLNSPPEKNVPLLMGLIGIWYNNFLKAQTHAVIPYCERLGLFVDHLQQLDMESNGKSSTLEGGPVELETGPIVWGQTGTNGQHAFFQLLHQGTKLVPVDFIGTIHDELSKPEHHRVLLANMIAQSEALMTGQNNADPHQQYPGNRPSSTLLLDKLDPESLGMLLALYEQKVFVQGVIWSINSFDQWGVELGKQLTNKILDGSTDHDPSTSVLLQKTGLSD